MINRRFMIVPPALPSGGHADPLEKQAKIFLCLLLEMANMRVQRYKGRLSCVVEAPTKRLKPT
jgi:hypothetical protein